MTYHCLDCLGSTTLALAGSEGSGEVINIFPSGRLCSLCGVLMMWLLPVFLLVGTVSAAGAYWTYTRMVATFMDDQMSLLAESLSAQSGSPVLPAVGARQVHERGAYAVQVYGRAGGLQAASWQGLPVGFLDKPVFHDVRAGGALWRVYVSDDQGPQHVQVAQSGSFRAHLAAERALAVIAPVLVLLLLSGLILWGVVCLGATEPQAFAGAAHKGPFTVQT